MPSDATRCQLRGGLYPSRVQIRETPLKATHFARLSDTSLRDAWQDEARDFTPWLSDNIDYLSEALGLELEATETEVAVDTFSADIIATEARTGARVLIENQLEGSDHKHLGQILTYLAGLDAKSVIWVARGFQEAHRSAVRWLNENTAPDFAFFAVRLRVVRIGDSPFAPVFEMVEKPNTWERALARRANAAEAELTRLRQSFCNRYLERHPGTFEPTRASNVWISMIHDESVVLSVYVARRESGMFLRGPRGTDGKQLAAFMARHAEVLDKAFGPSRSVTDGHYYGTWTDIPLRQEDRWDELIDWMEAQRIRYADVFRAIDLAGRGGDQDVVVGDGRVVEPERQ